jgi:hypothetical protein
MPNKHIVWVSLIVISGVWNPNNSAQATDLVVPEQFQEFDASSERTIDYAVLTLWLRSVVVDIGRSDRGKAAHTHASIGTRIKPKFKRSTIYEGNRVFFEGLEENEDSRQLLKDIRTRLERLPDAVPLKQFNRSEQLAYWLNLYNFTLLDEIASVYPMRDLKDLTVGDDAVLKRKLLRVSGVELSLNDIHYTILKHNYDNDPLIIYGLYQGIIGGPNIRRAAYTGENVYSALADNAKEFINSNRGTSGRSNHARTFDVSSFYARNASYFPVFTEDLTAHLSKYIEGSQLDQLRAASTLNPNIDDWTVTDLFGTYPEVRNGVATNPAALLGALRSSDPASVSGRSASMARNAAHSSRHSPEAFRHLIILNAKWTEANKKRSTVTVEDIEDDAAPNSTPQPESKLLPSEY